MAPARVPEVKLPFDCKDTGVTVLLVGMCDGLATLEGVRAAELLVG